MDLKDWLATCPLVAILRGVRAEEAEHVGAALIDAGVVIIEVPLNSPDPLRSIERLARRFGETALVGAGTVTTPGQVEEIRSVGGALVVTPHAAIDVVRAAKAAGMLACPGMFTPTEAFALLEAGADGLKLFPAEAASPAVLRALLAVLPRGTAILPVGGLAPDNLAAWTAAGAAGFGIGSAIYKPGDAASQVGAKARALVAALAG